MEIRKYQPLPLVRAIIMLLLNAIFGAVIVAFVLAGAPWPAILGAVLAEVATVIACWRFQQVHYEREAQIAFYTAQGVAVLPGLLRDWLGQQRTQLEKNIEQSIVWWCNRLATTGVASPDRIRDYVNGCDLTVKVQAGPVIVPRTNELSRGFTDGKHMTVWYPDVEDTTSVAAYLKGFENQTVSQVFFSVIRHEAGHWPLNAVGVPAGELQHKRMNDELFPDR